MREEIPGALDGERVDRAVALLTGLTRTEVAALVGAGAVRLDGRVVTARGRRVRSGQRLDAEVPPPAGAAPAPRADPTVPFTVVYEDPQVLVVDKPAGLVVHPGAGHRDATLVNGLLARYPDVAGAGGEADRPGIVHRLDRGTSGLLVVARTPAARESLVGQLAARRVERAYVALAHGTVEADEGVVDAPLGRSDRDPTLVTVHAAGRPARTHYAVTRRYPDRPATLLECRLETGRTHQIRVHLAAIGHAVVGDARYGPGVWDPLPPGRVFLHAGRLAFSHPATGRPVKCEVPPPADLLAVLDDLGPGVG